MTMVGLYYFVRNKEGVRAGECVPLAFWWDCGLVSSAIASSWQEELACKSVK